jgi:hypothetical protein
MGMSSLHAIVNWNGIAKPVVASVGIDSLTGNIALPLDNSEMRDLENRERVQLVNGVDRTATSDVRTVGRQSWKVRIRHVSQ